MEELVRQQALKSLDALAEQLKKGKPEMPVGQKCMRELEQFKRPAEQCADATTDYNGHGYWVCAHCDGVLEREFDEDYD